MKVKFSFTTCTLREAVDEINFVIKELGLSPVDEDDLVFARPIPQEEDGFEDYLFEFEKEIECDTEKVEEYLMGTGVGFEVVHSLADVLKKKG